ncbi:MAG: hypothetical protein HQM09_01745 [Candidatus Riflebacteria bacterium]|nr:hypothetical protein [Candidatus Riflebacteria bacterium]
MIFNRYLVSMILVVVLMIGVCLSVIYSMFMVYVPPGHMLVLISKNGDEMPSGQMLAKPGQKGVLEEVLGEGLHFVMPVIYHTEIKPIVRIPPGKIGVVVSKVGKLPASGTILVGEDERGTRRRVLTPGAYRLNPYGYVITEHDAVLIRAGYVGFVTSLVGREPKALTAKAADAKPGQENASASGIVFAGEGERGVHKDVLPPGLYYLNPLEFRVQEVEVGMYQINFLDKNNIRFPSKDAFDITIEATVEWELFPEHVAEVMVEFGNKQAIEEKIIIPQSKSIGRIQGSSYGAKEFLLGMEREKFQQTFTHELERICEMKNVTVHSAFIRHLTIPDNLLMPIRESFISVEREKTAKVWEETKKSAGDLERERSMIAQRRAEVTAQTAALVNITQAEADQEIGRVEADTRLQVAQKQQEIASIEASKTIMLGDAAATVVRLKGEATSKGIEAKIKAFGDNPKAFVNFSFARKMSPDLKLRMMYSGPGTLWTDLSGTAGIPDLAGMKLLRDGTGTHATLENSASSSPGTSITTPEVEHPIGPSQESTPQSR